MTQRVLAPWTAEQVESIRAYQASTYTTTLCCLNVMAHDPGVPLLVRPEGLACPSCGGMRDSVHADVANGSWRVVELEQAERMDDLVTRWHDGEGDGCGLPEWLGLSEEAYSQWVETSTVPALYRVPDRPRSTTSSPAGTRVSPAPSS